jgi:CubicO group peptidase (beta-lactamase class C family)
MIFPHEHPVEPGSVDIDGRLLSKAVDRFKKQQTSGLFPGGQLVLRRNGKLVLNEVCGIAQGYRQNEGKAPVEVHPRTAFPVLSAGKPLAAMAIALLEDRDALHVNAQVAEFIPGFEAHGKGEITVLDVLTHRAGILLPDLVKNPDLWGDRSAVLHHLIEAEPAYRRGTLAYMPYEYGWILSEVVSRVDGRILADFVADELSGPLDLPDLTIGLGGRDPESLAYLYWLGKDRMMVAGINVADGFHRGAQNGLSGVRPRS